MKTLLMVPDAGQQPTLIPPSPDYVEAAVMAADTSQAITIPAGAAFALFSASADFYAKPGTGSPTAAIPNASTSNGSAAQLNPRAWALGTETKIALISHTVQVITIAFYKLNTP